MGTPFWIALTAVAYLLGLRRGLRIAASLRPRATPPAEDAAGSTPSQTREPHP